MTKIYFSHANGFPASSYQYLFSLLNSSNIDYVETMGHASYNNKTDLAHLRDEIIDHILNTNHDPVIGIGHSSGGAAILLAAAKRPELFEKIILLDPVLFSGKKRFAIRLAKKLGFWERFSPAKQASRRRTHFQDRKEGALYFRQKQLFKHFHPRCFDNYIQHGLKKSKNGLELTFSAQVEADIFRNVPTQIPNNLNEVKGIIIYGNKSHLFTYTDINWWRKHHPNIKLIPFNGAHLFPFEAPEETAELLNQHC